MRGHGKGVVKRVAAAAFGAVAVASAAFYFSSSGDPLASPAIERLYPHPAMELAACFRVARRERTPPYPPFEDGYPAYRIGESASQVHTILYFEDTPQFGPGSSRVRAYTDRPFQPPWAPDIWMAAVDDCARTLRREREILQRR